MTKGGCEGWAEPKLKCAVLTKEFGNLLHSTP